MIEQIFFYTVFAMLGAVVTVSGFLVRYRLLALPVPKKGYAITYPTLQDAAQAYTGKGVIVRLDIFGPEPLTGAEIDRAGALYLDALKRAKKARLTLVHNGRAF